MTLHRPASIDEAGSLAGEFMAGSTDLSERLTSGVTTGPIVDLNGLPGMVDIEGDEGSGLTIGSGVRLAPLAVDARIAEHYPALALTAGALATPQIRNMATLGGVLCQHTRCTWYRHPELTCFRNGGTGCPAREAHLDHGVLFDLGGCVHPHPSSVALALIADGATIDTSERTGLTVAELYGDGSDPTRDHQLGPDEILLRIHLPPRLAGAGRSAAGYARLIARQAAEWPWAETVVRLTIKDDRVAEAAVAIGAVASIPLAAPQVAGALVGLTVGDLDGAARAASLAESTGPIYQPNRHKIAMLQGTILDAIENAWSAPKR